MVFSCAWDNPGPPEFSPTSKSHLLSLIVIALPSRQPTHATRSVQRRGDRGVSGTKFRNVFEESPKSGVRPAHKRAMVWNRDCTAVAIASQSVASRASDPGRIGAG